MVACSCRGAGPWEWGPTDMTCGRTSATTAHPDRGEPAGVRSVWTTGVKPIGWSGQGSHVFSLEGKIGQD